MDSTMSLGSEFSLFGEDLLFSPSAPIDEGFVTLSQDGLKASPLSPALAWQSDDICLDQDVLSSKVTTSGDLLEGWLDTRIDLLTLVAEQQQSFSSPALFADLGLEVPCQDDLVALKMEAEKTTLELSATTAFEQLSDVSEELPCQDSKNVYDQGLGLLDLLTSNVNQMQAHEVASLADQELDQNMDCSDAILSHMSLEDVESILSSGPSSPESPITEESFESLMSSVIASDSSFNESSTNIMSEVSLVDDNTLPTDWAILEVDASNDATSYVSMSSDGEDCGRVSKAQLKHNSRSNKRTSPKSKKEHGDGSGIVRIADRKLRKKQQNKDAATRYRLKKKIEQELINNDVAELEHRNTQLKEKVDRMTKEIQYLKSFIADVYKARAQVKKKSK